MSKMNFAEEHARFSAPLITKVYFYLPEKSGNKNQAKNAAHIEYIATRPGVEFNDEKDRDLSDAAIHVKYADERPGSHGLFSGSEDYPEVKAVQSELMDHQGIVYRVVLSLAEEDAQRIDYLDRDKWVDALRASVPDAAAKMGIPENNLKWVAAFHLEKGHPHAHLVLWEKTPMKRRGVLQPKQMEGVKQAFAKEIFAEERMLMNQEKTAMRELMRDLSKSELGNVAQVLRDIRKYDNEVLDEMRSMGVTPIGVSPKPFVTDQKELMDRIKQLSEVIPDRGRMSYQFMNKDVKALIDDTTEWFLNQPAFQESIDRYFKAVESMTRQYSHQDSDIRKAVSKAKIDLHKRISQIVLKSAVESKKMVWNKVDPEKAKVVIEEFKKAIGKPEQSFNQDVLAKTFEQLKLIGVSKDEQYSIAIDWIGKANLGVDEDTLVKIMDHVNSTPVDPQSVNEENIAQAEKVASNVLTLAGRSDNQIKEFFSKFEYAQEKIEDLLLNAKAFLNESSQRVVTNADWNKLKDLLNIKASYPWRVEEKQIIIPEMKQGIINSFRNAKSEEEDPGYTAFCMTVALKQLGCDSDERRSIMLDFDANNPVKDIEKILGRIDESETNFLRKTTWDKINANLNLSKPLDYPWINKEVLVLDESLIDQALQEIKGSTQTIESPDDAKWVATKIADLFTNSAENHPYQVIRDIVKDWADKTGSLSSEEVKDLQLLNKRTEDVNALSKVMGVRDQITETITNFAKVLFATELPTEEIKTMIEEWNVRSGLNFDRDKLNDIIDKLAKSAEELKFWGRTPHVSRKDFEELTKTLKVDAPYMWTNQRDRSPYRKNDPVANLAKSLWKNVWNEIEQERTRTHAQGQMLKNQNHRRLEREAEQER